MHIGGGACYNSKSRKGSADMYTRIYEAQPTRLGFNFFFDILAMRLGLNFFSMVGAGALWSGGFFPSLAKRRDGKGSDARRENPGQALNNDDKN